MAQRVSCGYKRNRIFYTMFTIRDFAWKGLLAEEDFGALVASMMAKRGTSIEVLEDCYLLLAAAAPLLKPSILEIHN
ncbi:hypothetical protein TWF970_011437 [Orbilia oligospora]|uniref:Uncharacterized protein n=1 Tax=Orbilia oligospora TaxID=2813651 RepID=A0A7C8VJN4_ORBOL|nr:hypothetical protein TWF970_011437 [Orbilia oligospora]